MTSRIPRTPCQTMAINDGGAADVQDRRTEPPCEQHLSVQQKTRKSNMYKV
jgi:hypothetical protein